VNSTSRAQVFDGWALAKFSIGAMIGCMIFDCLYAWILPMVTALPIEIALLLVVTYFLGWWGRHFRYTMKTSVLVLSFILPSVAMAMLVSILMALQAARGWA
jgi:hypothetical protein